jgi:hypothetical protein
MDDVAKAFAPELSPTGSRKWIGRLVVAVLVGVAIWNFVVSLTLNVVLPALARIMEADPQSPLYLGKGDLNPAPLFAAVLELCFALIAAILVNSWSQRAPKPARKRSASAAPSAMSAAAPSIALAAPTPRVAQPTDLSPVPTTAPVAPQPSNPPQAAQAPASPAKGEKPSKPKKVYYNIVGERIEADDE